MKPTDKEIEEARYFIIECSTKGMTRAETLLAFLESKREEIERKAYDAGVANEIAWNKYGIFEPYDYWKKKNKEQ